MSALIVDDSITVRMDLAEAFETAGFRTELCSTLADARSALAGGSFSVLVLDVLLPDGDGLDLLAEVRRSAGGADLAILLLSTEVEVRDRIRGLRTGADEYVGKPYERQYVIARSLELVRARSLPVPTSSATTVLVIDGSATFREALRSALTDAGYDVVVATSGEEGLRIAADRRPSAIMVDGMLPGIDGATVIRRVRLDAALRAVPCLLVTGSMGRGAELSALDAGADAFVAKHDEMGVILAKLAAVLRRASGATPSDEKSSVLGPKKILAVDDSVTYLAELGDALRLEGYDVILARSGEEALELLAVEPVDCVLLDVIMPGLSGQDTCRRIKAAPGVRDIPLIMLTTLDDRAAMIDALSVGADDYIAKSDDFEILKARMRAQIRRRHFEAEVHHAREEVLRKELETAEAHAARDLAQARARLVDDLEHKNQELEAFSYSVSHDLRAPLRTIAGFSQALLDDHAHALDATGQHYLRRIRSAAQRMGELIDDLLDLSKVGRAALSPAPCDLSKLAENVIAELRTEAPGRAVELDVQPGLVVEADAQLMRVVLENLLGNAWKFTAKSTRATISLGKDDVKGERVYFVKDNGAGFNMDFAGKLFSPFQRLHAETDYPGSGIGLATVRRIVDRHGGRVWAEGATGRGASVYFTLPGGGT